MSTEGTCSRGQTGHSDNGLTFAAVTVTSADGSSSPTDPNLNIRRRPHERSKYTCKRSGLSCENIDQLLCHETTHDGWRFVCAEADCQCSYVYKGGLKKHMNRMHNKLYRYRCETCERGFMDRCRYHDHIAAHTGVKRHTCSICEMKFTYKTSLRTHVLHIHPNEDAHIL